MNNLYFNIMSGKVCIFFKIWGNLMHDFNNTKGFSAFSKIRGSLMHDLKNIMRFGAFFHLIVFASD